MKLHNVTWLRNCCDTMWLDCKKNLWQSPWSTQGKLGGCCCLASLLTFQWHSIHINTCWINLGPFGLVIMPPESCGVREFEVSSRDFGHSLNLLIRCHFWELDPTLAHSWLTCRIGAASYTWEALIQTGVRTTSKSSRDLSMRMNSLSNLQWSKSCFYR